MHLNHYRQENYCTFGTKFYDCEDSGFTGCCSVDACRYSTCPDNEFLSASVTTITLIIQLPSSPQTTPYSTATYTSASTRGTNSQTPKLSGTTALPTKPPTIPITLSTSHSSSSSSKIPIIAGIVMGVVGAAFIALLWSCYRRRKRGPNVDSSTVSGNILDMSTSGTEEPIDNIWNEMPPSKYLRFNHCKNSVYSTGAFVEGQQEDHIRSIESDPEEKVLLISKEKCVPEPPPLHEHPALQPSLNQPPKARNPVDQPFNPSSKPLNPTLYAYYPANLNLRFGPLITSRIDLPSSAVPRPLFSSELSTSTKAEVTSLPAHSALKIPRRI